MISETRDSGFQFTQDVSPNELIRVEEVARYIDLVFTTIFLYDSSWVTLTSDYYLRANLLVVLLFHNEVWMFKGQIGGLIHAFCPRLSTYGYERTYWILYQTKCGLQSHLRSKTSFVYLLVRWILIDTKSVLNSSEPICRSHSSSCHSHRYELWFPNQKSYQAVLLPLAFTRRQTTAQYVF